MACRIHPRAIIDPKAELDSSVEVGPGAVIGAQVRIGADTIVGPYAVLEGPTTVGARNRIYQLASVGAAPEVLDYKGEPSRLEIGDDNMIREFASIHRGTERGGMVTKIGNHVLVMNYAHVAHDCMIGDHCRIADYSGLAGHIVVEEWAIISPYCGIHQFSKIGAHAFLAAGAKVERDVPPYAMVNGEERARLVGVNEVGLERRGFAPETIKALRRSYRTLFYAKLLRQEAMAQVSDKDGHIPEVRRLLEFISNSERGVVGRDRE